MEKPIQKESRIVNSSRNLVISVASQLLKLILLFVTRVVFLHTIGMAYLGVNGLLTNILTLLALPELGFGTAIIFYMYKPVNDGDVEKIKSILKLYKKLYSIIAGVITILGLALLPFIDYFVNMPEGTNLNVKIVYLLFLANTVVGYFIAYKRAIIEANQKMFIENLNRSIVQVILCVFQIISILVWGNYYLYLALMITATIVENITLSHLADKMYPYIKERATPLASSETKNIFKNTSYIFINKVSNAVLIGTDSIVINMFLGIEMVGAYNNYEFVYTAIATFVGYFMTSICASVGNLIVNADKTMLYDRYKKITFVFNLINTFTAICLFVLLSPFVRLWAGEQYLVKWGVVLAMVSSYYLNNNRNYLRVYKNSSGLFKNGVYFYLVEVILNIGISIILAKYIGLVGVVIGTIASYLLTSFIMEPYVVYKHCFGEKPIKYHLQAMLYYAITFIFGAAVYYICDFIPNSTVMMFIVKMVVCVIVSGVISIIIAMASPYRKFIIDTVKFLLIKLKIIKGKNTQESMENK